MRSASLFDWPASLAGFARHFPLEAAPWAWLDAIASALAQLPDPEPLRGPLPPGVHLEGKVWLGEGVQLPAHATILGPAWIGAGTEIRPGAFIRGQLIAGAHCVLGNSCEFKNCLLLEGAKVPHFSYVGDSVLGNGAHLGAGVILSNLRLDQKPVAVRAGGVLHDSGRRKVGAFVGDGAEVGCNAVLQPGAVLGRQSLVMPLVAFAGELPERQIARVRQRVELLPRRDLD